MQTKQFGALHFYVLAALLITSILVALATLFFLDRAMLARTVVDRQSSGAGQTPSRGNNSRGTTIFEVSPDGTANQLGGTLDVNSLNNGGIDATTAKEKLRTAPAESIQSVVKEKTGKNISTDQIEKARTKALSSEGQKKINEALKRRDEIDLSNIRNKLQ